MLVLTAMVAMARAGINVLPARDRYLIPIAVYAVLNNLILIIDSALTLICVGELLFLRSLSAVMCLPT